MIKVPYECYPVSDRISDLGCRIFGRIFGRISGIQMREISGRISHSADSKHLQ